MIDVRELRVGNLVNFCGTEKQIEGISIRHRPDCGYYQLSGQEIWQKGIHLSPIPITEEWLLKLGFQYSQTDKSHVYKLNKYIYVTYVFAGKFKGKKYLHMISISYEDFGHIKNVHNLQNLYFDLTNQELTIKP